ncbi:hypothetical protein [Crenobacter luteus]|uniref:hypothetical protein n=1 Tax=Crenobacter luteus TaxID=1452487 RepID=UPI0014045DA2|nr:hypothetical protein [Crenobacter luteus]
MKDIYLASFVLRYKPVAARPQRQKARPDRSLALASIRPETKRGKAGRALPIDGR